MSLAGVTFAGTVRLQITNIKCCTGRHTGVHTHTHTCQTIQQRDTHTLLVLLPCNTGVTLGRVHTHHGSRNPHGVTIVHATINKTPPQPSNAPAQNKFLNKEQNK